MYQDVKRIRRHRATVNLDCYENDLITALVNYTGISQAELLRTLAMRAAKRHLLGEDQSDEQPSVGESVVPALG